MAQGEGSGRVSTEPGEGRLIAVEGFGLGAAQGNSPFDFFQPWEPFPLTCLPWPLVCQPRLRGKGGDAKQVARECCGCTKHTRLLA